VCAYSQGDNHIVDAPLEAIFVARLRAALSSIELLCDCIFKVMHLQPRKERYNESRSKQEAF